MKGTGKVFMEKFKKAIVAGLILLMGLFSLTACSKTNQTQASRSSSESTTTQVSREPLEVKKITCLVYCGGLPHVIIYIITSDLKVEKYYIKLERYDVYYDYLAGELPPEDQYEITEFEITDQEWSSIVNVLTRVNFMELDEDVSTESIVDDASSCFIMVETSDSVHTSGGYCPGIDDNDNSRRFAEAWEMIYNTVM